MQKKVLVGMSGGFDSTVTAILLQKEGYIVEGVYMKLHNNNSYHQENIEKANKVAKYLNIPIHILDLTNSFKEKVYDYFIESYKEGQTPNPCTICNQNIKFKELIDFADSLNIQFLATGHYVLKKENSLFMGKDKTKDQSYFLSQINPNIIKRLIFPLGDKIKEDIKKYAFNIEILKEIASQKESSEICFVENRYQEVLAKHINIDMQGETLNSKGEVVGTHKGYMHYTIGKRRGFFVNGAHDPHFVLKIDAKKNHIIVGKREELAINQFNIEDINLFNKVEELECLVKVRYRTKAIECIADFKNGKVKLKEPTYGVAKGQFAVFYKKEELLGGAKIVLDNE